MEKRLIQLTLIFLIISLIGCAPKTSSEEAARKAATGNENIAPNISTRPEQKAWETEWDTVLRAAKKEGKVVISSVRGPDLVQPLRESFTNKYGIQLEHISGQGPALHQKIATEYKNGVTGIDVYLPGSTGLINVLKPAGAVDPIDPELIFPDVTDPEVIKKVWLDGKLDWIDRDHTGLAYLSKPNTSIVINSDLVSPEEIKSYRDLLNPKWQGKIIMDDPTQPGSGQNSIGVIGDVLMGWDFIRDLVKQNPMISRDHRLMAEWLAHGKYSITIGVLPDSIKQFQRAGAPLKFIIPREGTYRSTMGSIITLPKGRPHPNAARVFINWTLSAEAGAIWTKWYAPSSRVDVSKKELDPIELFQPGIQYFSGDSEEWVKKAPERMVKAREIIAPLLK